MACMCGDTHCWSCGPAQGVYRCSVCRKWSDDGGCEDRAACEKEMVQESLAEAKYYASLEEAKYYASLEGEENDGDSY